MTALDKKINQLAARHRWNVTPVHDRFIPCYSIVPMDRQERDRIKATLDRCKGLKVKVEQVFSPYAWTCTIYVFDPAGDPMQRAGSRASGGKMGKRKRPGQTARRALLLWPLVCTGGNGSGGVRPGAGGGADLLAVPVGMVSAGTVPAVGVPASRLALAVLNPGRFLPFAGGVRFST